MLASDFTLEIDPLETVHCWKQMPKCNKFARARSKHTVVAFKNVVYVFGGDDGNTMLNDLLCFDVKEKSWGWTISTGTPPTPRYHHSAVIHQHSMFVFGGYTGDIPSNSNLSNRNDLHEYNFCTGHWTEWRIYSGIVPEARSAHGAVVFDNKLWIFAGYDGNNRLNDMWCIPLKGEINVWEKIQQLGDCPPTCCNFPASVARDQMYVFSGQSGAHITNALFQFNFKTSTWSRINCDHILRGAPEPPVRRYGHTMVAYDRHLYIFGGAAESTLSNDLHAFDLDTEMWSTIVPDRTSNMPAPRLFHASTIINDSMYIFGGTVDNNVRSSEMFRFQFGSYPKCTLRDDFGKLLITKQLCDVEFHVGSKDQLQRLYGHMAIIAARSNYLQKLLRTTAHKNSDKHIIYLPDVDPAIFRLILEYIYTDCIDLLHSSTTNVLKILSVFHLTIQFELTHLHDLCVQYLSSIISTDNVLEILLAAHKLDLIAIREHCLLFIIKSSNFNTIIMTREFEQLPKQLLVEIIRLKSNALNVKTLTQLQTKVSNGHLENDLYEFLHNEKGKDFCDINLVLDNTVIPAHKCILAARSGYFEALFRSFMPNDRRINIQIGEIIPSLQSFHSLLSYIYCGRIDMPPEDSLYLFPASAYYALSNARLQIFCKHNLEMNISDANVLQILEAADQMQASDIKSYALKLIIHHFDNIVKVPHLKHLDKKLILDILFALANEKCTDINNKDYVM